MERGKVPAFHRRRFPAWAKDIEQCVLARASTVVGMANLEDAPKCLGASDILFYALLELPRF